MLCDFVQEGEYAQCKCCKFRIKATGKINKNCSESCKEYPTMVEMAGNFVKSMVDFAKDGFKVVDDQEKERRLVICKECPFYDGEQDRCRSCGCNSSLSSRIASHHCPQNKW